MLNNFYKEDWVSEAIVETMDQPAVIVDDKEIIVYVNNSFEKLSKYKKKDLIGQPSSMLYAQEEIDKIHPGLHKLIWEGKTWEGEVELIQKDSGILRVGITIRPLKNTKGDIEGFFGIYEDLTEIIEAKKEASLSEEKYKKIFNSAPRLITFVYEDGILKDCNDRIEEILGYKKEEVIGKNINMFFPELYFGKVKDHIDLLMKQGSVDEREYKMIKKDGTIIDVTIKSSIGEDETGRKHTICFVADITRSKRAEEQIIREKDKAQQYLDIAGVIFIVIDIERKVTLINKKGCKVLGYKEKEIIGKNWFENFIPHDIKHDVEGIYNKIMSDELVEYYENNILTKSGEERIIAWHNNILKNENNDVIGCISSGEDITNRKLAENQIKRASQELKRSNEELEQFAYVSSHDMQEPLRVVSSYCQLLKEKYYQKMDEDGKKYLDYSIDATFRMKILIKELLDFYRVGRKDIPFELIDLNDLVKEVLKDFERSIKNEKIKIIIENNMPEIFAIEFRIKQLLTNLLSNSIKFRGKNPTEIRIGCCEESTETHWLFYISDNGVGIPSEFYERIFGVFKRLYSIEEYPGTGIGLALCKRIVETHGGKIWVDSEVNKGSCFYFTISKYVEKVVY